ncbi:MAG TPA: alpha/beta hydrolase [Gemmatimonadaceae bacterium]
MFRFVVAALCCAQALVAQTRTWRDPAPHRSGFVVVAPNVRLHYLDYGGTGPTLLLIPGLGNTAHAWDDFAPSFTDRYHVVAITRRGFGESAHPKEGYETAQLVEDLRAAIARLRLGKVILVGHSIAGEEMNRFAVRYPDEVTKLVYLDAAYDRIAADSMFTEAFVVSPDIPPRPQPTARDTATPEAYVRFVHATRGINIPESDIRTRYRYDGWNEEITRAYQSVGVERPNYRAIRHPALAIYAVTDTVTQMEPWQRADHARVSGLMELIRGTEAVEKKLRDMFRTQVPRGEVLEIHGGHHWIFISHRDEVIAATKRFLAQP